MAKKSTETNLVPSQLGATDLQAVMESEAKKRALITQYISQHMKSGVDYGTIKFGNRESKPSLFKPGSEKFLSLFKLTARFEKDKDTWEMAGSEAGVFAYKCELLASNGSIVGEGRGIAKLTEKAGWTINNAVKIAEKRAQIDAVLRTGALSDFFTQDLEDMAQSYDTSPVANTAVPTVTYDDPEAPADNEDDVESVKSPTPWKDADPKKLTVLGLKKQIKELADKAVLVPLERGEYEEWIKSQTGLDVTDQSTPNLRAIIERLNALSF